MHRTLALLTVFLCSLAVGAQATSLPGKFVWAELATDDVTAAKQFYGQLFGWTFTEVDGYVTANNGEQPVAGLFHYPRPKDRPSRPRWIASIASTDLQQTRSAVLVAGGAVRAEEQALPGHGRRIVFSDPEGALFGALHDPAGDPEDYLADVGSWIWLQLLSRDVQQAARFYSAVGGYELYQNPAAATGQRYFLTRNGYARAALLQLPDEARQRNAPPSWLPFVRVEAVDAGIARAVALGGKVLVAPRPDLFDGRVAVIEDPAGAVIGLMRWDADATGEGDTP